MKRRTLHLLFALLTTSIAIAALVQWTRLHQTQALSTALQTVPARLQQSDSSLPDDSTQPQVQLAIANALSAGGNLEQAEAAFNKIIATHDFSPIGQAARFNLANAYLRQGIDAEDESARSQAMLELAKQRYRDLLREVPLHWGVRYNLERALRLAPENPAAADEDAIDPVKRVRVIVPGFEKQDLP